MPEQSRKKQLLLKRRKIQRNRHKHFLRSMFCKHTRRQSPSLLTSSTDSSPELLETIDFTSPQQLFSSILSPAVDEKTFFTSSEYWETKPLIIKRNSTSSTSGSGSSAADSTQYSKDYCSLFSLSDLRELTTRGLLKYGQHVNVCRYVHGKRECLNGEGTISIEELNQLWTEEKATFQFHQPQQFKDVLWRMLSLLETYFSCLVGSNVYITPSGSQGLAPHYDDVEVLILQLEGKKHWRLYPPPMALPETCSEDLDVQDIGEPSHDFILEAGDVMYFPRGTVHHADTPPDVPYSTHLTISTYQKHSVGNLLRQYLPLIVERLVEDNPLFRVGLPLNHLSLPNGHGYQWQRHITTPPHIHDGLINKALIDELMRTILDSANSIQEQNSIDFITSRLPPYYTNETEVEPRGRTPGIMDKVCLCWPDHTYLHCYPKLNGHKEQDEWVYVYHSLHNSRRSHMTVSAANPKGVKFPRTHVEALRLIFNHPFDGVKVLSLPVLSKEEKLSLVMTLWAEGLLEVPRQLTA